ncbi:hypothetical protein CHS65_004595 [Salmonella enterica]|uniref:Uncharacterized protein n=1 Tax=Salmonella enterica TaxID=28901 RepID=A0A749BQB9_SALER|nr:hypothetical protein [Salmonella enterica subsp. diarizonae]EDR3747959.1 hypothetical protein [Salmonella enterica]EDT6429911.1 hypothetical protein [Salmonella enterica subsp. enterica]EDT6984559.1 hypothetical protein [Salmonella enterica subsp. arizonae]EDW4547536.1 hypothetical protein [Salmonella enterica subsp. salamae]EEE1022060.1 hypothetical protein [Salmonella enterica subsp. enterica serovar Miami]EGE4751040.1 hypothetical protein [Salmonella enterica subsp. diarizonae serovar 3
MKISSSTPCLNISPQKEYPAAIVPHPSKNACTISTADNQMRVTTLNL